MKRISIIILLMIGLSLLLLTGCQQLGVTPEINQGNTGDTGTVDTGGTVATEGAGTVGVDVTKPVIAGSRSPLPDSSGWNNTDVIVSFSCADTGSVQSGIDINTVAGKTVTTEGKDQSVTNTGECIDAAGNIADPVTVSGINIDKTPPVVIITLTKNGKYSLNESVTATWSATDVLSGVEDSKSKPPQTIKLDTTSKGKKKITLPPGLVKDEAGNSSEEVTISYEVVEDTEDPGTVYPQKWSGLGMGLFSTENTSEFDEYVDILLANGFTELRIGLPAYNDTWYIAQTKAAIARAVAKGAKVIWGVCSGGAPLTASNWEAFRQGVKDAATWAQASGVYEFLIGNEDEMDTTLTLSQLITNFKSLATEVQAIFTNGRVGYSCWAEYNSRTAWLAAGKGAMDFLATNVYMGGEGSYNNEWKSIIDAFVNKFGVDGTYLTEFAPSWSGIDDFSTDEAVQATAVTEMIEYIKASGITRALYYCWKDPLHLPGFGILKDDGTYSLLWNQALLNTEPVKFATVPSTTTIISLPATIALIPRITR